MDEKRFLEEVSAFAAMTLREKLNRAVELTKKHVVVMGVIFLVASVVAFIVFSILGFIMMGTASTETIEALRVGHYVALPLPVILLVCLILLSFNLFIIGLYSFILRHIHDEEVPNVSAIIAEPFGRLNIIILPLCFWMVINFSSSYLSNTIPKEQTLLFLIYFVIFAVMVFVHSCFSFYMATTKSATFSGAIIEPFRIVLNDFINWIGTFALLFFIFIATLFSMVFVISTNIIMVITNAWLLIAISIIIMVLASLYFLVFYCYFVGLTYRQSSARLLLKREAGRIDFNRAFKNDSFKKSSSDSPNDSPNDSSNDSSNDSDKNI